MNRQSRLAETRNVLLKNKQISVDDLCRRFHASSVTIRKDLTFLEEENFLIRTHGGAVLKEADGTAAGGGGIDPSSEDERGRKIRALAEVAADYTVNNTWIYLSTGSTCYEIARMMTGRKLNVVTSSLTTGTLLASMNTISVLMPGGNVAYDANGAFLAGDWFRKGLDDLHLDQAFISVSGIDFTTGYTIGNPLELLNIKKLKEVSRETIIVADSTKFGAHGFLTAEPLDSIDTIITNSDIPREYLDYYDAHGIRVLTD